MDRLTRLGHRVDAEVERWPAVHEFWGLVNAGVYFSVSP